MNGYDAQDMATQGADGFRNGYQAGYADAVKAIEAVQPAAAQEAVGEAGAMPGTDGFTMACFRAEDVPVGTKLYAAPVTAAPVVEAVELTVCCGREECGGECGNEWSGTEWVRKAASTPAAPVDDDFPAFLRDVATAAELVRTGGQSKQLAARLREGVSKRQQPARRKTASTPAAPGIDLAGKSGLLRRARSLFDQDREYALERGDSHHAGQCTKDIASIDALIDASRKGGSEAQPMFYIQDTRGFVGNCPMWWGPDGRGYVTRLDEAGRYTEEEAIQQNKARDTDIPWPCDEIDKLARPTVDFQHMRPRSERLAELVAQAGDAEVQP